MAIAKITGAQRDFSGGELDVAMKRADENPLMKIGARQASNWRILNSGAATNRPGRSALFPAAGRVEEVLMSPGNIFFLVFGAGSLSVYNAAGTQVFTSTLKGDGSTNIPWTTATVKNVTFVVAAGSQRAIYICYGDDAPVNVPQVLAWDGVSQTSTWTLTTFAETITPGGQKRTLFYRISPQNITMLPSATSGNIDITFSSPVLVSGMIGTRMRFINRQILITAVTLSNFTTPTAGPSQYGTATVEEPLYPGQALGVAANVTGVVSVGDVIIGETSGAEGIVTALVGGGTGIDVQLIQNDGGHVIAFAANEVAVGPSYAITLTSNPPGGPFAVSLWDDEVMNLFRGYPTSVSFDQNRLILNNFPSVPSGIGWSAIGLFLDFYVAALPANAIFELAPGKSQVLFVQPGMESSEFVFCDNAVYYIPITPANPLVPGSVAFNLLSEQGSMPNVRPQPAQQSILYMKAGGTQVGAVQAPGAYYRPYIVDNVSEFHSHLFTASPAIAIAAPSAPGQFEEMYAYILLANGNCIIGKYAVRNGLLDVGVDGKPKIGWLPWNGVGKPTWVSAQGGDVIFTTGYGGQINTSWGGTWNPAILTSTTAYSNGNLTITRTGYPLAGSITTISHTNGIYFLTFTTNANFSAPVNLATGAGDGIVVIDLTSGKNGIAIDGTGEIWVLLAVATDTGINLGSTSSAVIGVVFDATNALAWFQVNGGLWNGSPTANPFTGVGGINFWTSTNAPGPNTNGDQLTWLGALGTAGAAVTINPTATLVGTSVVEKLDATQYLDSALLVNSLPAPFAPPGGKGPLYVFPGPSSTVTLMDQGYRMMGTYSVDANGFIIPQNNDGENLTLSTLVAGQPWTATLEPFVPDAQPGQSVHQRMFPRRVARFAVYVSNSTGFLMARLFSGPLRPRSPVLGTIMNFRRWTAWNQGDDPTQPPPLREEAQRTRPLGRSFDPRVSIIKDTPGPIVIHEAGLESTI
jgi:hypothetical protein